MILYIYDYNSKKELLFNALICVSFTLLIWTGSIIFSSFDLDKLVSPFNVNKINKLKKENIYNKQFNKQ